MEFVGNKKAVEFLTKSIKNDLLSHAYLFSGPEGVGKKTLAGMFAMAVIAGKEINSEVDFCDRQALLDLVLVEPETVEKKDVVKVRDIPIEAVRDAQQKLSLFPYRGKYKVLIVKDAHRMSNSAQNALLKLLEEPNRTAILILVTSEPDKILPTVQSRCEKLNFSLVSETELTKAFEKENNFVFDVVPLAMGRPAIANLILKNPEELEARRNSRQQLNSLRTGSLNEKMLLAEEFSKDVRKTLDSLNVWIWSLRNEALANSDEEKRSEIFQTIEKMQKSMTLLKSTNANARLLLEVLFMEI